MLEETITSTTTTLNLSDGPVSISADGTYTITQTESTPTTNTIKVNPGVTATITLKDVNISASCALDMHGESESQKTTVTLLLEGNNTLKSRIYTGQYGVLTIDGAGSLFVTGSQSAAAIGGGANDLTKIVHGGTIRINGGNITAIPGQYGSAIGDGDYWNPAGSKEEGSASVTITGGTITIPSVSGKVGCIGYGGDSNSIGGSVIVTGGTINFPSNLDIGNDINHYIRSGIVIIGPDVTIKKMSDGTERETEEIPNGEFISKIQQEKGFVFSNNTAEVKGDVTLPENMQIPADATLTIPEGTSLTIEEGHYLINYGQITNANQITGTIINRGETDLVASAGTTVIRQIELTADMITVAENEFIYKNSQWTPAVTVQNTSASSAVASSLYETTYGENINAGEGTVTICMNESYESGALFGEATKTFTISKANPTITLTVPTGDALVYNGEPKTATATVAGVAGETAELTASLSYQKKNGDAWVDLAGDEKPKDVGTYRAVATFTGTDNYNALTQNSNEFSITAKGLTDAMVSLSSESFTYTGSEQKPTVTVTNGTTVLTENTDYNLTWSEGCTIVGTYTVTVTGQGNYQETVNKTFTIAQAANNWTVDLAIAGWTYGELANSPLATAAFGTPSFSYAAAEDGEYTGTIPTAAGTWWVKASVDCTDNYTALTSTLSFTISKATPTITLSVPAENALVYDGNAKKATASVSGVAGESEVLTATLSYEKKTGDNTWEALQDENKPTDVGEYRVTASFAACTNYNAVEETATFTITPAPAELSFAQTALTMTKGNAVPANRLTNPHTCTVTYTSSEPTVATVNAETGEVTVIGVGTTTIKATAEGNYTGTASYTLKVNRYIPPYYPPSDPIYYTVTIPTEVTGAIIHGGGTHEVEEYTYYTFRIELDPNGNGEYPTVTKGYWWDTLTPDRQGNYSVYVMGNTQITIGEVPTNSYLYYQVTLPTDSVTEAENQYWSGDYIEVVGASPLRAAEEAVTRYQAPFGATVTLRPIETERRKFLQWEDGSKQKERTLTLRADQEIKALWQRISPTGIEAIAAGSVIRGERGQLYIEVPEPCDVTLYTYGGVPVRVARLAAGANRLANLNAGLYLVKLGAAPAVPVRIR